MDQKHLNLLCDIGELGSLLAGSADIEAFLQRTVIMVARHLQASVCSIYLYDEEAGELILQATLGLNADCVGQVRMKLGEGLVGRCLKDHKPICEASARNNPDFKYFQETGEERFESFLAVPIQRGVEKIGVLVVQHEEKDHFTPNDVMALRASASQLAGAIENARVLIDLHQDRGTKPAPSTTPKGQSLIRGQIASEGYALAPVTVLGDEHDWAMEELDNETGSEGDIKAALEATEHQLEELQERLEKKLPEIAALIFTAHRMMLKDSNFVGQMLQHVEEGGSPLQAVRKVAGQYIKAFKASSHDYMREKANDVEDLARRILNNLRPVDRKRSASCEGHVVVARELYPSDILKLTSENVAGVVLVSGGATSHVAILARSLQIPLLIVNDPQLLELSKGTLLLLDGVVGNLFVNPDTDVIHQFNLRDSARKATEDAIGEMTDKTKTADGTHIQLLANINLLSELSLAKELKAEGIGLYRTEFPFLIRQTFPSEDEQYLVYSQLFATMERKPITMRTLDVGGDKVLAYYDDTGEANPELGLRSIRFSLRHPDVFRQQIRAILRAGADANRLRIVFPMVSSLDEFREARNILLACIQELAQEGQAHHSHPRIGMMIEVPSVVETIDAFAEEADFFSIGTNDFVQYMLGVDRTNEKVASYYRPHHPAVLRALYRIVKAATQAGKEVSVCGEMAHEERYLRFLIGIGIRQLSVDPHFLPAMQKAISGFTIEEAEEKARRLLQASSIRDVEAIL